MGSYFLRIRPHILNPLRSYAGLCKKYIQHLFHQEARHQAEAEEGALVLGAREVSCEFGNSRKGGTLKPGSYICLEDGEGVEVSVTSIEEEFVRGMSHGMA